MDSHQSYKVDSGKTRWRYKQHLCSLFTGMILFAVGVAIRVIIGYFIPGPNDSCKQVVPQETVQQQGQGKGQTTTS